MSSSVELSSWDGGSSEACMPTRIFSASWWEVGTHIVPPKSPRVLTLLNFLASLHTGNQQLQPSFLLPFFGVNYVISS